MVEYLTDREMYPVDLVDVQEYLRVDTNDDVDVISRLIRAGTERCEGQTGRTLMTRKLRIVLPNLPVEFKLERGPIQTIDKIVLVDIDDNEEEVDISDVLIFDKANNGLVVNKKGRWNYSGSPLYFNVDYFAGYGDLRSDVPYELTQSIMDYVAFYYENRGSNEMPKDILDVWIRNRIYEL